MTAARTKVVACATVIEEILPLLPEGVTYEVLDFGLHLTPENLRNSLQETIDAASAEADTIILGYGLCSMAVVGLKATGGTLVIPRVDDCIAIFLGSHAAYKRQISQEPGTYYLTKGWIEVNDTPFAEYDWLVERYGPLARVAARPGPRQPWSRLGPRTGRAGEPPVPAAPVQAGRAEQAERIIKLMLKNYTRLALIDTGHYEQERYRAYARRMARQFGLRYEEIPGSTALIKKMIYGPWDGDFVIARPGDTISYADFKTPAVTTYNLSGLPVTSVETG